MGNKRKIASLEKKIASLKTLKASYINSPKNTAKIIKLLTIKNNLAPNDLTRNRLDERIANLRAKDSCNKFIIRINTKIAKLKEKLYILKAEL